MTFREMLNQIKRFQKKKFNSFIWGIALLFFFLGIAFILWALFLDKFIEVDTLNFFQWTYPKSIAISFLTQIGGSFVIIAVLAITSEKAFKIFLRKDIALFNIKVAENVHDAIFENFVDQDILKEVKRQVFLSPFIYRNYSGDYNAEGIAMVGEEKCIKFSSEVVFTVSNVSWENKEFKGKLTYTSAEFERHLKPIEHERVEIRKNNIVILSLNKEKCRLLVNQNQTDNEEYSLPYNVKIPRGESVEVKLCRTIFLKEKRDDLTIFFKKPTINMNLKMRFPSPNYKVNYIPSVPFETGRFKFNKKHHGTEFHIGCKGVFLPYQGVVVDWRNTE